MRSGFTHYAEHYVERFTVTPFSEKLVTTHNVSLRIREDGADPVVSFSAGKRKDAGSTPRLLWLPFFFKNCDLWTLSRDFALYS